MPTSHWHTSSLCFPASSRPWVSAGAGWGVRQCLEDVLHWSSEQLRASSCLVRQGNLCSSHTSCAIWRLHLRHPGAATASSSSPSSSAATPTYRAASPASLVVIGGVRVRCSCVGTGRVATTLGCVGHLRCEVGSSASLLLCYLCLCFFFLCVCLGDSPKAGSPPPVTLTGANAPRCV